MRALIALLIFSQFAPADFLEIRLVVETGKGSKTYDDPGHPGATLTVSDEMVVSEKHIAEAWPMRDGDTSSLSVNLNAEGEKRMVAATKDLPPHTARMAVIIDDKVVTAPVVHAVPLGKSFVINGGSFEEAKAMADKLSAAKKAAAKPVNFEIRRVVAPGQGTLKVTVQGSGENPKLEELTLSNEVIVDRKGLASCWQGNYPGAPNLNFQLTEEAAKGMEEATKDLNPAKPLRLVILVNGKAISAPLVRSRLGKNLGVDGVEEAVAKEIVEKLKAPAK